MESTPQSLRMERRGQARPTPWLVSVRQGQLVGVREEQCGWVSRRGWEAWERVGRLGKSSVGGAADMVVRTRVVEWLHYWE